MPAQSSEGDDGAERTKSLHEIALERQRRAEKRAASAREHQERAEREAAEALDEQSRQRLRQEAKTHARAVELQQQAIRAQAEHARAHPDPVGDADDEQMAPP